MAVPILIIIFYTVGWFACLLLGAYGVGWLAPLYTAAACVITLKKVQGADFALIFLNLLFALFCGFFLEWIFIATGLVHYTGYAFFPPLWILALYPLFGMLVATIFTVFYNRLLIAFLASLVIAPLTYLGGAQMGAAQIESHALYWIGVLWATFFILLLKVAKTLFTIAQHLVMQAHSSPYTLLVDESCPICSREVTHLRNRSSGKPVHFVDISAENYDPSKYLNISRSTALKQIHGIDHEENVQVGIEAFAQVYARTDHLTLAILYTAPYTRYLAKVAYVLFAKNRHFLSRK